MVSIVLRLCGDATAPGGTIKTAQLEDGQSFIIGRDEGCDWPISDGHRMMSRRHCTMQRRGDDILLVDMSSNGTSVGTPGNHLIKEQPTRLPDSTKIYLGGKHVWLEYECERERGEERVEEDFWGLGEHKRDREPDSPKLAAVPDLDLFGDDRDDQDSPLGKALGEADHRQHDPLDVDDTSREKRKEFIPEERPEDRMTFSTPKAAQPDIDLFATDESDPFADLGGGKPASAGGLDLEDDEAPSPAPERPAAPTRETASLDDLDLGAGTAPVEREPAPRQPTTETAPAETPERRPQERPAVDDSPVAEAPPMPLRPRDDAFPSTVPPRPLPKEEVRAAPEPRRETAVNGGTSPANREAERALEALFVAIGISIDNIPPEHRREMATEIGRSFRAMAEGIRVLLESRRDVKLALGLGATQVETGSNPLKFARDTNSAVKALLQPSASGFLSGESAANDAVDELMRHQLALVGGVKASMKVALAAFEPRAIEKKIESRGLGQLIAMKRKAELWERFVEHYDDFAAEADEDIRRVIGKELEKLYSREGGRARQTLDF